MTCTTFSTGLKATALFAGLMTGTTAHAASFSVTSLNDSGANTLRAAITEVNRQALPVGQSHSIVIKTKGTITLSTPLPAIANSVQIIGPGPDALTIDASVAKGAAQYPCDVPVLDFRITADWSGWRRGNPLPPRPDPRFFAVDGVKLTGGSNGIRSYSYGVSAPMYSELEVTDVHAVQNGCGEGAFNFGGGLYALHTHLYVRDSEIEDNEALGGGGIYTEDGFLSVYNTNVHSNRARHGGGLRIGPLHPGSVIEHSSIYDNEAFNGGGLILGRIYIDPLHIVNTTISSNYARQSGGGIFFTQALNTPSSVEALRLYHVTITKNAAGYEGGGLKFQKTISSAATHMWMRNSIISENKNGDCSSYPATAHRFVGSDNLNQDDTCGLSKIDNIIGLSAQLNKLSTNGYDTPHHLPGVNSPAIGQATDCARLDQVFNNRAGEECDIGAAER